MVPGPGQAGGMIVAASRRPGTNRGANSLDNERSPGRQRSCFRFQELPRISGTAACYGCPYDSTAIALRARTQQAALYGGCPRGDPVLDDLQQEKNQNDREDKADAAAPVVAPSWPHTVTTISKSEDKYQQNDNQQHGSLPRYLRCRSTHLEPMFRKWARHTDSIQKVSRRRAEELGCIANMARLYTVQFSVLAAFLSAT